MVNSFSDGKGKLVEPPYGSYVDEWQKPVNSNFGLTDALVSGTTTLDVSTLTPSTPYFTLVFQDFDTSPTPWLNPLAGQNLRIVVTGSLSFNVIIYIPQNRPGMWLIQNNTSGAYSVTVATTASGFATIAVPQSYISYVFSDGSNILWADAGNVVANSAQGIPSGTIISFGGANIPSGYLWCNGGAVSRVIYASLFAAIGTTWGSGDGSTTFNVPDLQNMFLRGTGSLGVGAYEADGVGPLTLNDPGHRHNQTYGAAFEQGGPPAIPAWRDNTRTLNYLTDPSNTGITITNTISETRPKNKRVLYLIKT